MPHFDYRKTAYGRFLYQMGINHLKCVGKSQEQVITDSGFTITDSKRKDFKPIKNSSGVHTGFFYRPSTGQICTAEGMKWGKVEVPVKRRVFIDRTNSGLYRCVLYNEGYYVCTRVYSFIDNALKCKNNWVVFNKFPPKAGADE